MSAITGFEPHTIALLALGTFVVSLFVSALGPTGGIQLAIVAALLPPPVAIPVHGWISAISAIARGWTLRAHIDWRYFFAFAPLSLITSSMALVVAFHINVNVLELVVGGFIVLSSAHGALAARAHALRGLANPYVAGVATGFLTVFVGATGPLLFSLMLSRYSDRRELMATHSACLSVQHASKVVLFSAMGVLIFRYPLLLASTTLASWLGTRVGSTALAKVPERTYRIVATVLVFASGIWIIARALRSF